MRSQILKAWTILKNVPLGSLKQFIKLLPDLLYVINRVACLKTKAPLLNVVIVKYFCFDMRVTSALPTIPKL